MHGDMFTLSKVLQSAMFGNKVPNLGCHEW